mmetsp:Transcript_157720/g.294180  ORF Transcript_157720/g.294180 Transcript_157720/m.294180 type:complete len:154 (+) Transcript_157720:107-568(+)
MSLCQSCCASTESEVMVEAYPSTTDEVRGIAKVEEEPTETQAAQEDTIPEPVKEEAKVEEPPPPKGLEVVFRVPVVGDDKFRTIIFTKTPLGVTFENKVPVLVKNLVDGGHGEALGIKKGWEFHSVAGTNVADKSFNDVLELLKAGASKLPTA